MKLLIFAFALMSLLTITIAGSGGHDLPKCKEESLKCGGGNPGGAVFVCRKGRWDVLIACGAGESCKTDPVPTCTWAKAVTGFEIPGTLIAADVKKKAATASTASVDNKVWKASLDPDPQSNPLQTDDATEAETADDAPYYNICSPCIRYNDWCQAVSNVDAISVMMSIDTNRSSATGKARPATSTATSRPAASILPPAIGVSTPSLAVTSASGLAPEHSSQPLRAASLSQTAGFALETVKAECYTGKIDFEERRPVSYDH